MTTMIIKVLKKKVHTLSINKKRFFVVSAVLVLHVLPAPDVWQAFPSTFFAFLFIVCTKSWTVT